MNIERFTELAAAHGAARERWPEQSRALFDRLSPTPEGMAVLADAGRVDALLAAWTPRVDDGDRVSRILAAAADNAAVFVPAAHARRNPRALAAWLSTGFAASAVLGFALGFTQASASGDEAAYAEMLFADTSVLEEFP